MTAYPPGVGGPTAYMSPRTEELPAGAPHPITERATSCADLEVLGQTTIFDRVPWLYAFCRENLFRDDTARMRPALWPEGGPRPGSRLLELGCGPGVYTRRFARLFRQIDAMGVDRSEEQLRGARRRARAGMLDNCRFVRGDVHALQWATGTFDAVIASRLFMILPRRAQVLGEAYRVLGTGGRCFIAEPRVQLIAALPLHAMRLYAGVVDAVSGAAAPRHSEPARTLVMTDAEFGALVASQPWDQSQCWTDGRYHYALCQKG